MPDAGTQPRRARPLLAAVLIVVAVAGAGVAGVFFVWRRAEQVTGVVRADGMSVGSFAFDVNDCLSGQGLEPIFFGADLRGGVGANLRVVSSGDAAMLWLYPPKLVSRAIGVNRQHCTRWDVKVDSANVTKNGVDAVSGHVHVTCTAEGGRLTADVEFERCAR